MLGDNGLGAQTRIDFSPLPTAQVPVVFGQSTLAAIQQMISNNHIPVYATVLNALFDFQTDVAATGPIYNSLLTGVTFAPGS